MRGSNTRKASSRRKRSAIVVAVTNRQRRRVDRRVLERAVRSVLELGRSAAAEIVVAIVDASTIRRLNRQFLGHDYVTDALSFRFSPQGERTVVGEIVVCADLAAKMASKQPWSWHEELTLYVVHAGLHLVGYNDQTAAQRRRMRSAERDILDQLGLSVEPGALRKPASSVPRKTRPKP